MSLNEQNPRAKDKPGFSLRMESNDYNGGFEHFLKEKADQYKLYPSDKVWNAINDRLHPRNKWPYLFVAAIFIGLGIGGNIYDSTLSKLSVRKESTMQSPGIAASLPGAVLQEPGKKAPLTVAYVNPHEPVGDRANSVSTKGSKLIFVQGGQARQKSIASVPGTDLRETILNDLEPTEDIVSSVETPETGNNPDALESSNLLINNRIQVPAMINDVQKRAPQKLVTDSRKAPKTTAIRVLRPYKNKFGLQFYASPTVSYRRLQGSGIKTLSSNLNSYNYSGDVNKVVNHRPLMGTEVGAALVFSMNKKLRFRTGLQFNLNQYDVEAYSYTAELVPMTSAGIGHSQVNAISTLRSTSAGTSRTSIRNQHLMVSIPIGAELTVFDSRNVQLNIAGSLQPTYSINNQAYMVSSDLKNYAQVPSLYRNFNLNTAIEAFLSIKSGSTKWSIGPQLRYQVLSSFKKEYPISEHLIDYGLKVGMTRTLK